jgi:shikimate dehydrogenase
MQMAAFRALGLPHTYEAIRVTADELPGLVQALRDGTFAGLNVTVPHKTRVLEYVDEDRSAGTGAANTLVRSDHGRVVAYNTDVAALDQELMDMAPSATRTISRRALVLGSGGAARAAVVALAQRGFQDVVVRARRARGGFEALPVRAWQPWEPSPASERETYAIVQATSAGMHGADPGEGVADAVAWQQVPDDAVALDVVYAPPETPFLRAARTRGLRAANGLGMLARQGAAAFERWLGPRTINKDGSPGPGLVAPLDVMLAALRDP